MISPKRSWGSIAVEFLAAKKSPETLKAFVNTVLAELWEEKHETPMDERALWNRCEPFESEAPDGAALITAGVDVQADRLEVELVGWGRDEESWSIAYHVIPGDIMRNEVWDHLEGLLTSECMHESGLGMRVVAAAIDCGFKDALVLRFTRDRYARRVYAVKGRPGQTPIWPRKPSRKNQTPFFMVGVDAAKTAIYDRLKIQEPGPGFCHFPAWARVGVLRAVDGGEEIHALSQRLPEAGMEEGRRREERSAGLPGVRLRGAVCAVRERVASGCALRQVRADGGWSTR